MLSFRIVYALMFIFFVVAWPLSKLLDCILGGEEHKYLGYDIFQFLPQFHALKRFIKVWTRRPFRAMSDELLPPQKNFQELKTWPISGKKWKTRPFVASFFPVCFQERGAEGSRGIARSSAARIWGYRQSSDFGWSSHHQGVHWKQHSFAISKDPQTNTVEMVVEISFSSQSLTLQAHTAQTWLTNDSHLFGCRVLWKWETNASEMRWFPLRKCSWLTRTPDWTDRPWDLWVKFVNLLCQQPRLVSVLVVRYFSWLQLQLLKESHSRVPVYDGEKTNVVGVLLVKMLITLDPELAIPIKTLLQDSVCFRSVNYVPETMPLFDLLNHFQTGQSESIHNRRSLLIVLHLIVSPCRRRFLGVPHPKTTPGTPLEFILKMSRSLESWAEAETHFSTIRIFIKGAGAISPIQLLPIQADIRLAHGGLGLQNLNVIPIQDPQEDRLPLVSDK